MAIRFNNDLNSRIRNDVRNFNRRRDRLEKLGYKNLPKHQTVSELKKRYNVRSDLERELNFLRGFSKQDLTKKIEFDGGVKAIKWEYEYLKKNSKAAIAYYQREYDRISKRVGRFPGESLLLDNIVTKLDILNTNIRYMSQSEFRSALAAINEFNMHPSIRTKQYRGFLNEVEWVMQQIGYSNEQMDSFFKKFEKLTPSQFLYAYDNNDIINRIYSLYHKDYDETEARLTDTEDNARDLMDELLSQADEIVKDAQQNMD